MSPAVWGEMRDRIDPAVPQAVINAAIVQAMLDEAFSAYWSKRLRAYQYCDMTPTVKIAEVLPPARPGDLCAEDRWYVEVQYSSKGARAGYGVNKDHVANCYVN